MTDVVINIVTGHEDRRITGVDSAIFPLPDELYVDLGNGPALAVRALSKLLHAQSDQSARDLGEILHHAEWVVTSDPATVEAKGNMHDCEECRAGTRRCLRFLAEHPGKELCVGVLYWAAQ